MVLLGAGLASAVIGIAVGLPALRLSGLYLALVTLMAAALVGRLRSLWVTLFAGIAIGVIESSLSVFTEFSQLRAATPFVIAIVVLLWLGQTQGRSDSARTRGFDR